MANNKKIPITRVNKFFSEEDFRVDIEMGREAIEGDGNYTVILYRVDREQTTTDDVYNEAGMDEIRYLPPVELLVAPIHEEPEIKEYSNNLHYLEDGNLKFDIYVAQLEELDVDIRKGDYIGYPVTDSDIRFFSVANDGRKNWDNKHTIMGYKGYYRSIDCAPVDENEFRGL